MPHPIPPNNRSTTHRTEEIQTNPPPSPPLSSPISPSNHPPKIPRNSACSPGTTPRNPSQRCGACPPGSRPNRTAGRATARRRRPALNRLWEKSTGGSPTSPLPSGLSRDHFYRGTTFFCNACNYPLLFTGGFQLRLERKNKDRGVCLVQRRREPTLEDKTSRPVSVSMPIPGRLQHPPERPRPIHPPIHPSIQLFGTPAPFLSLAPSLISPTSPTYSDTYLDHHDPQPVRERTARIGRTLH